MKIINGHILNDYDKKSEFFYRKAVERFSFHYDSSSGFKILKYYVYSSRSKDQ